MKQFLTFLIGEETCALNLHEIQEVVECRRIDPFPGAPPAVAGAISFHGRVVPVVSMSELFGLASAKIGNRLIVLVNERGPFALGVDRVGAIITLDPSVRQGGEDHGGSDYIGKVVDWNGRMLGMLELERVGDELNRICDGMGG